MNKVNLKNLIIFILVLFVVVGFCHCVEAVEYGGLGGRPANPRPENPRTESIFVHTLEPGAVQEEAVLVVNNENETKTAKIYAVDSTPSTGGAFACEQRSADRDGVGAWIELEKSEVTLEPGKNEKVPFLIKVPESADVGEHNGCIVIQEKEESKGSGSGIRLSTRLGLRVAITVPGQLQRKLKIEGFKVEKRDDGSFLLQPGVKNLGNVSIDANIEVPTRYFFGLLHKKHEGQYPVLRGDTLAKNFVLEKPFWGGWYRSSFAVEYDAGSDAGIGVESGKKTTVLQGPSVLFFSFPKPLALAIEIVILAGLISLGFLFWLSKKRRRWIKEDWVEYEVKSEDNINDLAQRFDVSWKLLAKANKLQPPYALKKGEKIKVPPEE